MERESAGDETCPCGGGRARGEESAGGEICPCGGGRAWGERSLLAMRPVPCEGGRARGEGLVNGLCHGLTDGNGLGGAMERESAGDETCPCGGGRTWEERSLLAVRLVPCGGGWA